MVIRCFCSLHGKKAPDGMYPVAARANETIKYTKTVNI
jgi:hypothetical protein